MNSIALQAYLLLTFCVGHVFERSEAGNRLRHIRADRSAERFVYKLRFSDGKKQTDELIMFMVGPQSGYCEIGGRRQCAWSLVGAGTVLLKSNAYLPIFQPPSTPIPPDSSFLVLGRPGVGTLICDELLLEAEKKARPRSSLVLVREALRGSWRKEGSPQDSQPREHELVIRGLSAPSTSTPPFERLDLSATPKERSVFVSITLAGHKTGLKLGAVDLQGTNMKSHTYTEAILELLTYNGG